MKHHQNKGVFGFTKEADAILRKNEEKENIKMNEKEKFRRLTTREQEQKNASSGGNDTGRKRTKMKD